MHPEWKFKKMTPEDTNRNPVHLEFFRNEALSNPVDAIVREDIQNRLDENWHDIQYFKGFWAYDGTIADCLT